MHRLANDSEEQIQINGAKTVRKENPWDAGGEDHNCDNAQRRDQGEVARHTVVKLNVNGATQTDSDKDISVTKKDKGIN